MLRPGRAFHGREPFALPCRAPLHLLCGGACRLRPASRWRCSCCFSSPGPRAAEPPAQGRRGRPARARPRRVSCTRCGSKVAALPAGDRAPGSEGSLSVTGVAPAQPLPGAASGFPPAAPAGVDVRARRRDEGHSRPRPPVRASRRPSVLVEQSPDQGHQVHPSPVTVSGGRNSPQGRGEPPQRPPAGPAARPRRRPRGRPLGARPVPAAPPRSTMAVRGGRRSTLGACSRYSRRSLPWRGARDREHQPRFEPEQSPPPPQRPGARPQPAGMAPPRGPSRDGSSVLLRVPTPPAWPARQQARRRGLPRKDPSGTSLRTRPRRPPPS